MAQEMKEVKFTVTIPVRANDVNGEIGALVKIVNRLKIFRTWKVERQEEAPRG
jgi:hypothetical protein